MPIGCIRCQPRGNKNYILCNKFLKFVHSSIGIAGGGGIYDLYCSPSPEGAVLRVSSPSEEADGIHSIYSLCFLHALTLQSPAVHPSDSILPPSVQMCTAPLVLITVCPFISPPT
ncbi:Hypothetical predicted protein [Xyrichtys novacula]|uniref:Uncharacterized protein n=1 Tax=Xyrichtys novacula TaxID=13765 RepID=A0AAV1F0I0_XYRNO|nr:Hypothetical predicted protein [Xyrichtys novacula]